MPTTGSYGMIHNFIIKIVAKVAGYSLSSLLAPLITMVAMVCFTRELGPSEYGRYSVMYGIAVLASSVLSQWVQQSTVRFLSSDQFSPETQQSMLVQAYTYTGLAGVVIGALATGVCRVLSLDRWRSLLYPAVVLTIALSLFTSLQALLQAKQQAGRYAFYTISQAVLRLVLGLACMFSGAMGLLWSTAVATLILVIPLWMQNSLPVPTLSHLKGWKDPSNRLFLTYGLPMTGWYLASNLLNISDRFVIQWARDSFEVGLYDANYSLIAGVARAVAAPVMLALAPIVYDHWDRQEEAVAKQYLNIMLHLFVCFGAAATSVLALWAHDICEVMLGPDYVQGAAIMPVVLAGVVIWSIGTILHKPFELAGRTVPMFLSAFGAAVVNVLLNVIFVPSLGYTVAAYTTLASYLLYASCIIIILKKYYSHHFEYRPVVQVMLAALVSTISAKAALTVVVRYTAGVAFVFVKLSVTLALIVAISWVALKGLNYLGRPEQHEC